MHHTLSSPSQVYKDCVVSGVSSPSFFPPWEFFHLHFTYLDVNFTLKKPWILSCRVCHGLVGSRSQLTQFHDELSIGPSLLRVEIHLQNFRIPFGTLKDKSEWILSAWLFVFIIETGWVWHGASLTGSSSTVSGRFSQSFLGNFFFLWDPDCKPTSLPAFCQDRALPAPLIRGLQVDLPPALCRVHWMLGQVGFTSSTNAFRACWADESVENTFLLPQQLFLLQGMLGNSVSNHGEKALIRSSSDQIFHKVGSPSRKSSSPSFTNTPLLAVQVCWELQECLLCALRNTWRVTCLCTRACSSYQGHWFQWPRP